MDATTIVERHPMIELAVASAPLADEPRSGDAHVFAERSGGALVAVIDGLGHGEDAAHAADVAVATLTDHADEPVEQLLTRCHAALRGTRGAAITVASFGARAATLSYLGVGNVEGALVRPGGEGRARESFVLRGGVVGFILPPLRAGVLPVAPGDTLVLATDGVRPGFLGQVPPGERPERTARRMLDEHATGTDDALVLVARFLGDAA